MNTSINRYGQIYDYYAIIASRIPISARVLVTCSRNVAVESIAQKLENCTNNRLAVFGRSARVDDTAQKHLLNAQCRRLPGVCKIRKFSARVDEASENL